MDPIAAVRRLNELSAEIDTLSECEHCIANVAEEMAQIWDGLYGWLAAGGTIPAEAFQ